MTPSTGDTHTAFAFPQQVNCTPLSELNFTDNWSINKCYRTPRAPIQVKVTPTDWYIYCPNNSFTSGSRQRYVYSCPPHVFKVERNKASARSDIVVGQQIRLGCQELYRVVSSTLHVDFEKQLSIDHAYYHLNRDTLQMEEKLRQHLQILRSFKLRELVILSSGTNLDQLWPLLLLGCILVILVIICVCTIRYSCTKMT